MRTAGIAAVAAALVATGCVSGAAPRLAADQEVCGPRLVWPDNGLLAQPSPQSGPSAKMGRENPLKSKANCTANRAEAQLASTRMEQRRNEAINFPAESPASN